MFWSVAKQIVHEVYVKSSRLIEHIWHDKSAYNKEYMVQDFVHYVEVKTLLHQMKI